MDNSRVIIWFSCGAASAVAAKLAIEKHGIFAHAVYCDTHESEHPDNARFLRDVERWLGKRIIIIQSQKFKNIDEVFTRTRYMAGIVGARCTTELKKIPRFDFQEPDDLHVFGYTADESKRIATFENNNPELRLEWILRDRGFTKEDCLSILTKARILPPVMYALGFKNNNCLGCVKASSPAYWQKTREHFPEVFNRRAAQSRAIGARLVRIDGERRFLDELPESSEPARITEDVSCGPECSNF